MPLFRQTIFGPALLTCRASFCTGLSTLCSVFLSSSYKPRNVVDPFHWH